MKRFDNRPLPQYIEYTLLWGKSSVQHPCFHLGVAINPIAHEVAEEMAEMEDRWLPVVEIGKYIGVSSDTVYRWIDKYTMPAHRMERLWKFKKDKVDARVEAGGAAECNTKGSDE